jgi:enamine deaminase RidA (YjgF/YER057c/UK114 family)
VRDQWVRLIVLTPEERLHKLGLVLPAPPQPAGAYLESKRVGRMLYLAGHGPIDGDKITTGQIGGDLTLEQGVAAAQLTGLSLLSTMHADVGLDAVQGIISVLGLVYCVPGFTQHPTVIDGCSDLFAEVFTEDGKHTRSAIGVASLPFGIPVEIECVALLHDR